MRYLLFVIGILMLFASCVSRMASPKLTGVVVDFEGNPIVDARVGETFTDSAGHFCLPERRYNAFILTELMVMEAPPVWVRFEIEREGFQTGQFEAFDKFGGGSPKGEYWELDTLWLMQEDETLTNERLLESGWMMSATAGFDTLYMMSGQLINPFFVLEKASMFRQRFTRYADNYLDSFGPDNLPEGVIRRNMDIGFSENGEFHFVKIDQRGDKKGKERLPEGVERYDTVGHTGHWRWEGDTALRLDSDFEATNHTYRIDEFGKGYFSMVRKASAAGDNLLENKN